MRAGRQLAAADVKFQPGINEELAATALWGTQQAELRGEGKFDGVFGMWYGKGPGVDRSGDVFRHANLAGTSKNGGVIALMGDDHTAESSTTAHQSEFHFVDVMMPILNPGGVQEIIDYALYGWAMSRFTGTWTALKCMHETVESTGVVDGSLERIKLVTPTDFHMPEGGLNIRLADTILGQEARLHDFKRDAMLAFVRANKLNKIVTSGGRNPKIGIITTGKAYLDVRQALDELGIDEVKCNDLGLRLFKIACVWPIGRQELAEFAQGLDLIIVVEEKRSLIEVQVREELYGTANQPVCIGKKDEQGNWLFPVKGALDPNDIAICIGERLLRYGANDELAANVARLKSAQHALSRNRRRRPAHSLFLLGLPAQHLDPRAGRQPRLCRHRLPLHGAVDGPQDARLHADGRRGRQLDRRGAVQQARRTCSRIWATAPTITPAIIAIRAAIASGVTMTYKILFNDAVAMTGGQANDGGLTVDQIARQVAAEGAKRVVVVTDEPWKYPKDTDWPRGLTVHHRDELDAVQRELTTVPGVSVLIYDQTCAAEKRRRRKRGTFPDPDKRVVINDLVCEGCGDCGVKSNCVSVQPLMTEWGRKRTIDQSSCNKDYSCIKGFCPSFVTVHGAKLKKGEGVAEPADWPALPEPSLPLTNHPYGIIVTGIGGTGIVTIGAILGMAAHLEGKGVGVIDMAGLAQKGGAVYSHIRIANTPDEIHAIRVAAGGADLVLGGDIVVVGNKKVLGAIKAGHTRVVVNTAEFLPGDFTRNADYSLPTERLKRAITAAAGPGRSHFVDASRLATALLGNSIGGNMFMLGYAYQAGALAAVGGSDRKGDRDERRGGGDEYRRLPLWPPRRGRSGRARSAGEAGAGTRQRFAQAVAVLRRDGGPARRLPHRLSERALRAALSALGREGESGGSHQSAGRMRAVGSGGALSVQADGLQGRVRSGAALHRHLIRRAGEVHLRRRQSALRVPSGAAAVRAPGQAYRRAEEDVVRAVAARRSARAEEVQGPARHAARSVRLYRGAQNRTALDRRI